MKMVLVLVMSASLCIGNLAYGQCSAAADACSTAYDACGQAQVAQSCSAAQEVPLCSQAVQSATGCSLVSQASSCGAGVAAWTPVRNWRANRLARVSARATSCGQSVRSSCGN